MTQEEPLGVAVYERKQQRKEAESAGQQDGLSLVLGSEDPLKKLFQPDPLLEQSNNQHRDKGSRC